MEPKLIDIHSHLNFSDFNKDREDVISRLRENDIWSIVVGTDKKSSEEAVLLAEKHSHLFATVGLHPTDTEEDFDYEFYKKLAQSPKVVAVGECGLDYFRIEGDGLGIKEKQKEIFKRQIELALELDKPLMIHCRNAYDDVLEILNSYFLIHNSKLRGNLHFFAGDWEQARRFLDLGFYLSFTGVITFARQYDEVIRKMPLERLMAETDAPFVAPEPHRGQRCEPVYVEYTARKIAEIRGDSFERIAEETVQNARRLFDI